MVQCDLPDVQCSSPKISMPIKQVGVENIELPFVLESKYGGFYQMLANVSLRTSLGSNLKGISMSRLLLTLKPYLDLPLKSSLIRQILEDLIDNLSEKDHTPSSSVMVFKFKLPMKKKSIVSSHSFPVFYRCKFEGQLENGTFRFFQGVIVQYASYCPCSAELCSDLQRKGMIGFPHNQRSFAHVLVECDLTKQLWLEDIIEAIEGVLPTQPYPIIKRVDEQEIARIAAENPMFVEDSVREISTALSNLKVKDWIVKCRHEESIHTSEAIAINWKGQPNGFNHLMVGGLHDF